MRGEVRAARNCRFWYLPAVIGPFGQERRASCLQLKFIPLNGRLSTDCLLLRFIVFQGWTWNSVMTANRKPDITLGSLNLLVLISFIFLTFPSELRSAPQEGSASNGKSLFEQKCSACHTIGGGRLVGPDLKGVTETRSQEWLTNFISDRAKTD